MATRNIKVGSQTVGNVMLGDTAIQKVYKGDTLLWDRTSTIPSFGGIVFTPGCIYYQNNTFKYNTSWKDIQGARSLQYSIYGLQSGSGMFRLTDMATVLDSRGTNWDTEFRNDTSYGKFYIDNANPIIEDTYEWRMITENELKTVIGVAVLDDYCNVLPLRAGATVNGTSGAYFDYVHITDIRDSVMSSVAAILLFPDNISITNSSLNLVNSTIGTFDTITGTQADELVERGCMILPALGGVFPTTSGGKSIINYSATTSASYVSYYFPIWSNTIGLNGGFYSGNPYCQSIAPSYSSITPAQAEFPINFAAAHPTSYYGVYTAQWLVRTVNNE